MNNGISDMNFTCVSCKEKIESSQTLVFINKKIYSGDDGSLIREYESPFHVACQPNIKHGEKLK